MVHEWIAHLLFEYDLAPLSIKSVDKRNSWRINTVHGDFFLKRLEIHQKQLSSTAEKIALLQKNEFSGVIPYEKTKYGEYFVTDGKYLYVLSPWIEKAKEIHELKKWETKVLKQMALMHKKSEMPSHSRDFYAGILTGVKNKWEERVEEFKSFRFKKHTRMNSLIDEGRKKALRLAQSAMSRIDEMNQSSLLEKSVRIAICHGRIHRKNIIVGKNAKIYFTHFENSTMDTPVKDIALFFRRYAPYIQWDPRLGHEWLKGYNQVYPLTHGEKFLLGSYLLFPERVIGEMLDHGKSPMFQKKGFYRWQKRVDELGAIERFVKTISYI